MIYVILILLTVLAVAGWLALAIREQDQLITHQRRRITYLERQIEQQQIRIAWHVTHTADVEARNAWLEWAVAHYITALPKVNRTGAINRITEISRN